MVRAAIKDFSGTFIYEIDAANIVWLKILVLSTPVVLIVILLCCWFQTREHIVKLKQRRAEVQHDRAVQIIALPAVYGLMSLSALTQLYVLACEQDISDEDRKIALGQYETVYKVGDLYEAWALYQFGKLTLEVLGATLKQRMDRSSGSDSNEILLSYSAVSNLMWLGTALFVVNCTIEAGWCLYQWTVGTAATDYETYELSSSKFTYGGLLASGAAIYNVHTVEHTYASVIENYSPFTKFLSVKLLVFFSFWQYRTLQVFQMLGALQMTDMQVQLLHSTLLVFECLLSALVHRYAWRADEEWYDMKPPQDQADER
eukprot:CAMPEP_0115379734 /NCGR_PEP_ID=MMETSP0271-20121206/4681_1 /TAXON_ID=71861 /ORGANISM="Scrippsiella trochoidea, Strain CCMP3099" /LENGTH=315 /DNA_ID=CAMNT_0002802939 /DNA_START=128 /DNA_END=1072 /DNA_ORIENTATION=+